jgi:hypothetical protein
LKRVTKSREVSGDMVVNLWSLQDACKLLTG